MQMRLSCFFFIFSLSLTLSFAQERDGVALDSLETLIDTTQSDSLRAMSILEWAKLGREINVRMKDWAKTVTPPYLKHLDSAVVYFVQKKDTLNIRNALAHIATYNIQTPDSVENIALRKFAHLRALEGFILRNNLLRADSSGEYSYYILKSEFQVLTDTSKMLQFEDILSPAYQKAFTGNFTHPLGFEENPKDKVFWINVNLKSENYRDDDYYFSVGFNHESWRKIDIYIQDSLGNYQHFRSGNDLPIKEKAIPEWRNKFKVFVPKKESRRVFIRLENPARILTPGMLSISQINSKKIREEEMKTWQINGVFFGMVFIQAIFFIFLFFTTRIRYYLYYIIFLLGVAMAMFVTNYLRFLAPAWIEYTTIANTVILTVQAVGLLYFAFYFLEMEKLSKHWLLFLRILSLTLLVLCGILSWRMAHIADYFFDDNKDDHIQNIISVIMTVGLLGLISMVYWGIKAHLAGHKTSKYLLIGVGVMLFGVGIPVLSAIFQNNLIGFDEAIISSQVSVIIQLAFFALAIGQQRKELEEEKRTALEEKLNLQEKINDASAKFVPFEFIRSLGKENILDVQLGDATEKEVTVLFSDIRGYTSLVENMSPEENFRFINDFHKTVGPSISNHQGFVNQYLGDGIMAIFLQSQDHALQAAIEIQQKVYNYTPLLPNNTVKSLHLGMGLHAGSLMMGIIGDDKRTDAATISDTVNTASRMEGLTKYYGTPILLSGAVVQRLTQKEMYKLRYLGKVQAKGKENHVEVYESLKGRPESEQDIFLETLPDFQKGIQAYYAKDFHGAQETFQLILSQNPTDLASQNYLSKSLQYLKEGVAEDWDGVLLMKSK